MSSFINDFDRRRDDRLIKRLKEKCC